MPSEPAPRDPVRVVVVPREDLRHAELVGAAEAELVRRYGDGDVGPPLGDAAVRLLALVADTAVGCAAVAPLPSAGPDVGELKRLYVVPSARRHGAASALLAAAHGAAGARGLRALHLVTGTLQPEAIALYERQGWRPIPAFAWAQDPMTRCYATDVTPAERPQA